MKCSVCKKQVAPQYMATQYGAVISVHPAKNGKGICKGSVKGGKR